MDGRRILSATAGNRLLSGFWSLSAVLGSELNYKVPKLVHAACACLFSGC